MLQMRQDRQVTPEVVRDADGTPRGGRGWAGSTARLARRQINRLLIGGAITTIVTAPLKGEQRAPSVTQASQFIQQAGEKMMVILGGSEAWQDKERQLLQLIDAKMDVYGIARFALGRFWNLASAVQRAEYVHLFPVVMLGSLGRSIGVFQYARFSIDRARQRDEWVDVWTTVFRPGNAPRQVDWLVGLPAGEIRIIDIIAEGSSLRITQRADVASFLTQHNNSITLLLDALRRRGAKV